MNGIQSRIGRRERKTRKRQTEGGERERDRQIEKGTDAQTDRQRDRETAKETDRRGRQSLLTVVLHVVVDALAADERLHEVDLGAEEVRVSLCQQHHRVRLLQGTLFARLKYAHHEIDFVVRG